MHHLQDVILILAGCNPAHGSDGLPQAASSELQTDVQLARGQVWFIPAGTSVQATVPADATEPLVMWAAGVNIKAMQRLAEALAAEQPSRLREKHLSLV